MAKLRTYFQKVRLRSRLGWAYLATLIAGVITAFALLVIQPAVAQLCVSIVVDSCAVQWSLVATIAVFLLMLIFTALWCGLGPWFWIAFATLTVLLLPFLLNVSQSWASPTLLALGPALSVLASLPRADGKRSLATMGGLVFALFASVLGIGFWLFFA